MTRTTSLLDTVMKPLPLGSIHPQGWLKHQLQIQAAGLSGHLDEFWPDIAQSSWIGGSAEGWERAPYWLDGLVPLAFSLDDAQLKAKVTRWLDYILTHQHADSWLGPIHDHTYGYEHDPWPLFILFKVFTQYYEATNDARVIPAMSRALHRIHHLLQEKPLTSWAQMRFADLLLSIHWLYRQTQEDWLLDLAHLVQTQGYAWRTQFENFPYTERQNEWKHDNHLVNIMMAIKQPAISYQLTHDEADRTAVWHMIQTLATYHGQATGVFTGDEVLAGKNPSQGTELCAVVEYMFSLENLLALLGDPAFGDHLERVTFNALPATFKPDMWAHQYDQQANQVLCTVSEDRVFATNGPDSNIYGLQPHFGCCTANMHQGWPKFASHLWMRTADNGLAALSYAPNQLKTQIADNDVSITVNTIYPFEEHVQLTISSVHAQRFPLLLRIPAWTQDASIQINGEQQEPVTPGTFHRIEREWATETTISLHLPMPLQTSTGYHNSISLERGPLVYALKIEEEWKHIRGELPHADWEVYPRSAWNYALDLDQTDPAKSCHISTHPLQGTPFSPEGAPIQLHVKGRRIPQWDIQHNAAGPLPYSPVTSTEALEELTLIPYGSTNLRITEFPTLA